MSNILKNIQKHFSNRHFKLKKYTQNILNKTANSFKDFSKSV